MRTLDELGISPAPWKRTGDWIVANANYDPIDGTTESTRVVETKSSADARLIAAAPRMYEALEECERKLDASDPYCNLLTKVRNALAAASGESEVAK